MKTRSLPLDLNPRPQKQTVRKLWERSSYYSGFRTFACVARLAGFQEVVGLKTVETAFLYSLRYTFNSTYVIITMIAIIIIRYIQKYVQLRSKMWEYIVRYYWFFLIHRSCSIYKIKLNFHYITLTLASDFIKFKVPLQHLCIIFACLRCV